MSPKELLTKDQRKAWEKTVSKKRFKAVNNALEQGLTTRQLLRAIEAGAVPGGGDMLDQARSADRLERKLQRDRRRAQVRADHFCSVADQLSEVWPRIAGVLHRGTTARTRNTDEVVLLALLKHAKDAGVPVSPQGSSTHTYDAFTVSQRTLMTTAALTSKSTLPAALRRLVADGLITATPPSGLFSKSSSLYSLTIPAVAMDGAVLAGVVYPPSLSYGGVLHKGNATISTSTEEILERRLHIVWLTPGLGWMARRVWSFLSHTEPLAVPAIVSALNLAPGTVRTALGRLRNVGLAASSKGLHSALHGDLASLERVAETLGISVARRWDDTGVVWGVVGNGARSTL